MRLTTTLAAGLALAVTATAATGQDGGLSAEDARGFIEPLGERAEEAVSAGDWKGIAGWLSEHVADDAPIAMSGRLLLSAGPALSYEASMKGANLTRFARMATASQPTSFAEAIKEYSLETDVMAVWQIPGGKVSMAVAFYETGLISAPEGSDDGQASGPFSSETKCALRLGGSPYAVVIEMASCEVGSML